MPGKVKVKVLSGRNLPVMDRGSDTTDAFVEIKLGSVTYKTDVCRKTLNPQWNSEYYTFEVEDSELQDEPLQIRLMDYDTYSANDAIGKVYINLSPLLHSSTASNPGKGSIMSGWLPVYDTIHGVRGEINVIVKVDLFTDFNKFRQSSCGVLFFHSPNIPYGHTVHMYHGFVEELVVNDDPEYQWIDKIRTPRASNEARQLAFMKLSSQVQRKIGMKAIELGANAVIGYTQCFDLEGDVGVVARGIGTAVTLSKTNESIPQPIGERIIVEGRNASESPEPQDSLRRSIKFDTSNEQQGNGSPTKCGSLVTTTSTSKEPLPVPIYRRSSDSDLSITPKGSSCPLDRSTGGTHSHGGSNKKSIVNYDTLDMLEYPFFTMNKYPQGVIMHIGATVAARSVKLLERVPNPDEPEARDGWWNEIRMEIRSHARSVGCNVILGYGEQTTIQDDVCVLSATGTAAVINLNYGGEVVALETLNNSAAHNQDSSKEFMTSSLDRHDFDREYSLPKDGAKELQKQTDIAPDGPPAPVPPVAAAAGSANNNTKCGLCHIPYTPSAINFRVHAAKCSTCKNGIVPDVLIATIEIPEGIQINGHGCLIQAQACRPKRDLKSEANAKEISDALPFLEYELHKVLVNKLKIKGMNAIFGLKSNITIGERAIALVATGTAVYLSALPKPLLPKVVDGNQHSDSKKLYELQCIVQKIVEKNIQKYKLHVANGEDDAAKKTGSTVSTNGRDTKDSKELDLFYSKNTACVLELDDITDLDLVAISKEPYAPDGFYVVNVQNMPGLYDMDNVKKFQMFTQIWRAKPPAQQTGSNLNRHFQGLLQLIYFKLRSMVPCAICDLKFQLDFPESDEIQIVVTGMALGLGDENSNNGSSNNSKLRPKKHSMGTAPKDQTRTNDDDMMFYLDDDSLESTVSSTGPIAPYAISNPKPQKSRIRSSHFGKMPAHPRTGKLVPFKEGCGVEITSLSFIPGGKVEKYFGNLNFFFTKECTSIRESGGVCGFVHSFITEVLSLVRAHVTSLGGNAMIAFYMNEVTLLNNVHKNQGQCLINVGGDVVFSSYHKDDK